MQQLENWKKPHKFKVWFFYKLHFSLVNICPASVFRHENLLSSCLILKALYCNKLLLPCVHTHRLSLKVNRGGTEVIYPKEQWYRYPQILSHKSFRKKERKRSHFSEIRNRTTGKKNAFDITVGSFSHPKEAKNKSFFLHKI